MKSETEWETQVKGALKAEMKRRNLTYEQLTERLEAIGVHDTPRNIINKINRGKFSAVFFVQCMEAVGCQTIRLSEQ